MYFYYRNLVAKLKNLTSLILIVAKSDFKSTYSICAGKILPSLSFT